jgi:putative component of membrane protein insertase Oxa1/YidC/SpoIIIJ protein YidD
MGNLSTAAHAVLARLRFNFIFNVANGITHCEWRNSRVSWELEPTCTGYTIGILANWAMLNSCRMTPNKYRRCGIFDNHYAGLQHHPVISDKKCTKYMFQHSNSTPQHSLKNIHTSWAMEHLWLYNWCYSFMYVISNLILHKTLNYFKWKKLLIARL